ncbi:15422_t:CDS:1 [Entrophospora sp. SA101]|nr:6286_t:CDS:1 [Entrophospora sp. SA101]CAJ0629820.1 15422_t:CDS:1 [Entrophospora sp. SA101]CAJ0842949.1 13684_t:CDS:1 [Entrophospora sp. SA101]
MAKEPKKLNKSNSNTMNSVLADNKTTPKSRQQIYQENYQKNKEHKKQQRRERYQQDKEIEKKKQKERYEQEKEKKQAQQKINYAKKKEREQLTTKQQSAKYYGAEAIKILLSLKEYTELNQQKHKLYADFC